MGYSRTYILDYTGETIIMRQLITQAGHRNLKAPLHLDVSERDCVVNGILWQKHQGGRKVLACLSSALEPQEKGLPECGKAICAIAKSLDKTAYIVLSYPVVVHTTTE